MNNYLSLTNIWNISDFHFWKRRLINLGRGILFSSHEWDHKFDKFHLNIDNKNITKRPITLLSCVYCWLWQVYYKWVSLNFLWFKNYLNTNRIWRSSYTPSHFPLHIKSCWIMIPEASLGPVKHLRWIW